jgi:hypothetical protein
MDEFFRLTEGAKRNKENIVRKMALITIGLRKDPRFEKLLTDENFIRNQSEANKYLDKFINKLLYAGADATSAQTLFHAHVDTWLESIEQYCVENDITEVKCNTATLGELVSFQI